jgi:hypothetical protein
MPNEQFEREVDYGVAMQIVKEMRNYGLITKPEFQKIERLYSEKYRPVYQYPAALRLLESRQDG